MAKIFIKSGSTFPKKILRKIVFKRMAFCFEKHENLMPSKITKRLLSKWILQGKIQRKFNHNGNRYVN